MLKHSSADRLLLSVPTKSRSIPVERKHRNSSLDLCSVYLDFYSLAAHMILNTEGKCGQKFTNDSSYTFETRYHIPNLAKLPRNDDGIHFSANKHACASSQDDRMGGQFKRKKNANARTYASVAAPRVSTTKRGE